MHQSDRFDEGNMVIQACGVDRVNLIEVKNMLGIWSKNTRIFILLKKVFFENICFMHFYSSLSHENYKQPKPNLFGKTSALNMINSKLGMDNQKSINIISPGDVKYTLADIHHTHNNSDDTSRCKNKCHRASANHCCWRVNRQRIGASHAPWLTVYNLLLLTVALLTLSVNAR